MLFLLCRDAAAHLISLFHGRGMADVPGIVGPGPENHAALNGIRHTAGKAPERGLHGFRQRLVRRGAGNDEIEGLARQLGEEGIAAVNDRLELRRHGIEVDGRGQDDDIRPQHFLPDLHHVVLLDADAVIPVAGIAAQAACHPFPGNRDLFHAASGFLCAPGKFVAQQAGIPVQPGTALQNQDLFHSAPLSS